MLSFKTVSYISRMNFLFGKQIILSLFFIKDSACANLFALLMFILPASNHIFKNFTAKNKRQLPTTPQKTVLDFNKMNAKIPYSFAFLLGGGFCLSTAASNKYTNLNGIIGQFLKDNLKALPAAAVLFLLIFCTVFITNFASNVAVANVIVPIAMELAFQLGQSPLSYCLATGIAASFCFCLPVGTPGNLVAQSSAKLSTKDMIVTGIMPSVFSIVLIWGSMLVYAPVVWPIINITPDSGLVEAQALYET